MVSFRFVRYICPTPTFVLDSSDEMGVFVSFDEWELSDLTKTPIVSELSEMKMGVCQIYLTNPKHTIA